jgi:dynein heavy chain, axonemal
MLCKISRILASPFGNGLMIGLGGAGSHTLTRLSSFIQDYRCYEIEVDKDFGNNEWLEYLRDMLRDIVMKDLGATFLLADAQLL